jgi:hypothetical protein
MEHQSKPCNSDHLKMLAGVLEKAREAIINSNGAPVNVEELENADGILPTDLPTNGLRGAWFRAAWFLVGC